jgi:hypothetical protein
MMFNGQLLFEVKLNSAIKPFKKGVRIIGKLEKSKRKQKINKPFLKTYWPEYNTGSIRYDPIISGRFAMDQ